MWIKIKFATSVLHSKILRYIKCIHVSYSIYTLLIVWNARHFSINVIALHFACEYLLFLCLYQCRNRATLNFWWMWMLLSRKHTFINIWVMQYSMKNRMLKMRATGAREMCANESVPKKGATEITYIIRLYIFYQNVHFVYMSVPFGFSLSHGCRATAYKTTHKTAQFLLPSTRKRNE